MTHALMVSCLWSWLLRAEAGPAGAAAQTVRRSPSRASSSGSDAPSPGVGREEVVDWDWSVIGTGHSPGRGMMHELFFAHFLPPHPQESFWFSLLTGV